MFSVRLDCSRCALLPSAPHLYTTPYTRLSAAYTSRRVSRRRFAPGLPASTGSSNVLTNTVPGGKRHSPLGEKAIFPEGMAMKGNFAAASDQNGTTRSYGIKPGAGVSVRTFAKAPVCDSSGGSASSEEHT